MSNKSSSSIYRMLLYVGCTLSSQVLEDSKPFQYKASGANDIYNIPAMLGN